MQLLQKVGQITVDLHSKGPGRKGNLLLRDIDLCLDGLLKSLRAKFNCIRGRICAKVKSVGSLKLIWTF